MFGRSVFWRFFLSLVLVGALIVGGVAVYQAGYGQGYTTGISARADSGTNVAPVSPAYGYGPYRFGMGFPFFQPFGLCLGIGFFLFFVFGISRLLFFGSMRRHWGEGGRYGHGPFWDRSGENQPGAGGDKSSEAKDPPQKS